MEPQHQLLNQMMGPDQVETTLQWICDIKKGLIDPPRGFNWFGMAEFSADNAFRLNSLEWARVSLEVYEWPDWKIEWGWGENAYLSEAMSIRQRMIHSFGAEPGHDVLDPSKVQELFFQCLPVSISVQEALSMAHSYRDSVQTKESKRPYIDASLKTRAVCAALRVIERLAEDGIAIWPEIEQWMAVKAELCDGQPRL